MQTQLAAALPCSAVERWREPLLLPVSGGKAAALPWGRVRLQRAVGCSRRCCVWWQSEGRAARPAPSGQKQFSPLLSGSSQGSMAYSRLHACDAYFAAAAGPEDWPGWQPLTTASPKFVRHALPWHRPRRVLGSLGLRVLGLPWHRPKKGLRCDLARPASEDASARGRGRETCFCGPCILCNLHNCALVFTPAGR